MNYKERIGEGFDATKKYFIFFLEWTLLGAFMGVIGGAVGAAFSAVLTLVTGIRAKHPAIVLFLPIAGIAIISIYKLCRLKKAGTNAVIETVRDERTVPMTLAPAVFAGTVLTHLFGGSAGREGAALQMGGSIASVIGHILPINEKQRHILTMSGMAALFSALFGTPVGACIFAVEVASVGRLYTAAFYPCITSSVTAYFVAVSLGVHPESYSVSYVPSLCIDAAWQTAVIGIAAALVGMLFCAAMHGSHLLFKSIFKNSFLRAAVGGIFVVLLTVLIGTGDYNGSGADIIDGIFDGATIKPEAFILKILFTAVTMGSGYKGGEIVPTLFIGATLGGTLASHIGMSIPFGAALGMMSLFGAVTNCPITALVLFVEIFGAEGMILCMFAVMISYLLSGRFSLYEGQKMKYSRLDDGRV